MHPKNNYQGSYNFKELVNVLPELKEVLIKNPRGEDTIKFSDPKAVKLLNKALLKSYYQIEYWDVPKGYLVPPIPSRSDYIHHVAELIASQEARPIRMLDIGTGANLIYPIVASTTYRWTVVGTDTDSKALQNAQQIINNNPRLTQKCRLRQQTNPKHILKGIINSDDRFDVVVCNPPFHASKAKAEQASNRKRRNLKYSKGSKTLNFGGQSNELWYPGGELAFLKTYIRESKAFTDQIEWCTSLVSSHRHIQPLQQLLKESKTKEAKVISMKHGQKDSHVLCWRL